MFTKAEKLRMLGEIQKLFGVADKDVDTLPERVETCIRETSVAPCLVTFAFNPVTLQLKQIAVSELPRDAKAYQIVAQVTARVAQQFTNIAMEVATDVGKQERVEGPMQQSEDGQP